MAYIKVSGTELVDANGKELILRGAGLGGWMKCVHPPYRHSQWLIFVQHGELHQRWVTNMWRKCYKSSQTNGAGYPGCEFQIRAALAEVVGKEKCELFFDKARKLSKPIARGCCN